MAISTKRIIGAIVAATVLGGGAFVFGKVMSAVNTATGGKSIKETIQLVQNPMGEFPAGTQRLNVLLIGKDYNHTNKGIIYTKGARSDTLMVFSLDLVQHKVTALSIPRDTYIPERHGKINAAYAQGGAPMAMETVSKLLGVPIDYSVALKPDGVKALVDELGGVEITALDRMKYDDNWGGLHIDLNPGTYTIDGTQAIGYTRFRKSNPGLAHSKEEGDSRRMARQQNLIRAMSAKALTPAIFLKLNELVDVGMNQIETDLKRSQLVALATIFKDVKPDQITSATLQGEDGRESGLYVFKPDPEKTKHLVDWLINGDENAANALTIVAVQNGTAIKGAAKKMATILKDEGYDAHSDGNAPPPPTSAPSPEPGIVTASVEYPTTRIIYHKAAVAVRAERIARFVGGGEVIKEPLSVGQESASTEDTGDHPADITIVLGRDLATQIAGTRQSAKL